jgi:hypothetical protein
MTDEQPTKNPPTPKPKDSGTTGKAPAPANLDKQIVAIGKRQEVEASAIKGLEMRIAKFEQSNPVSDVSLPQVQAQVAATRIFWKDARKQLDKMRVRVATMAAAPARPRNPLVQPNPVLVAESLRLQQLQAEVQILLGLAQRERTWAKSVKGQLRIASEDEYAEISDRLERRTDQAERQLIRRLVGLAAMAESIDPRIARPDFEKVARKLTKLRKDLKQTRRPGDPARAGDEQPA